jgi:hypothetical protein
LMEGIFMILIECKTEDFIIIQWEELPLRGTR